MCIFLYLEFFWGDAVFESSHTCLVVSVGYEGFIILGIFFGPLVPFSYYFYIRAYLGERSLLLYLAGPLGMLRIGGVI